MFFLMETDFINYNTTVESYYKSINSKQEFIVIWEKKLVDKCIWKISSQLKDILSCDIKLTFITDFPYEGKNLKLDKLRKITNLDLIKVNLQDNSLLDIAFQIAEENKSKKIVYLQDSTLKTIDKEKLNHINERNIAKLKLSPKLTSFVSEVFSHLDQSKIVERFHIINILRKKSFYKEIFTIDWAGDGNGVLIANNYDIEYANLSDLDDNIFLFLFAFIKDNQKFVKTRTIDYIVKNKENFVIGLIDDIPVGMFELMDLWENILEVWAFIIDENSQWLGLGHKFMDRIFAIKNSKEYRNAKVIMVSSNPVLKTILKDKWAEILEEEQIFDWVLKKRYITMLKDNSEDQQSRQMFQL